MSIKQKAICPSCCLFFSHFRRSALPEGDGDSEHETSTEEAALDQPQEVEEDGASDVLEEDLVRTAEALQDRLEAHPPASDVSATSPSTLPPSASQPS